MANYRARQRKQIAPFLRSYKRHRAELVRENYVRLTPRNGKHTPADLVARQQLEADLLALRTHRLRTN